MSWLIEHKRVWRAAILMLLLLASIGPWAFDRIVVPAEYACSAPFIRLKGDFCGTPLSGVWILLAVVGEAIRIVGSLVTGTSTFGEVGRLPLIVLLVLLPLLSFSSTLFLILGSAEELLFWLTLCSTPPSRAKGFADHAQTRD